MILPGATLGLLGGGQLGRMFTLRARTMGIPRRGVRPDPRSPGGQVAYRHVRAPDDEESSLRALRGLPLHEPRRLSPVAMINLLGDLWRGRSPRWIEAFRRPGVRLHLYGKSDPRPGRKMGHSNCLAADPDQALALALEARDALSGG